mgnify:CR=1 FL=1
MDHYHYVESGLDNVLIFGLRPEVDDAGEITITIPAIEELHRVISEGIVKRESAMSGKELKFLRTEMGLTQAELGALVHRDRQAVMAWERGPQSLDKNAEAIIRKHVIEALSLDIDLEIAALSKMVDRDPTGAEIQIERLGSNDNRTGAYRLAA